MRVHQRLVSVAIDVVPQVEHVNRMPEKRIREWSHWLFFNIINQKFPDKLHFYNNFTQWMRKNETLSQFKWLNQKRTAILTLNRWPLFGSCWIGCDCVCSAIFGMSITLMLFSSKSTAFSRGCAMRELHKRIWRCKKCINLCWLRSTWRQRGCKSKQEKNILIKFNRTDLVKSEKCVFRARKRCSHWSVPICQGYVNKSVHIHKIHTHSVCHTHE